MNYCNNCKKDFDEPVEYSNIHSEVTERDREYFAVCPNCGSSDYQEMEQCPCREEYVAPFPRNKWGICESCRTALDFEIAEIKKIFPHKVLAGDQSLIETYILENLWR